MTTTTALTTDQARSRLHELTVIDVRTPGEYVGGHLPARSTSPSTRSSARCPTSGTPQTAATS